MSFASQPCGTPVHRLQVKTLSCGARPTARSILFSRDTSPEPLATRFQCWLLRLQARTVLIDCGVPVADPRSRALTEARTTPDLCSTELDPASITDVVLTHLHWDHVGDVELFKNATIHVQARELDFLATDRFRRPALRDLFAAQDKLDWILHNPKLNPIRADAEIAPGIAATWVGGHTPGSQIVLAELAGQRAVFTGDVVNTMHNLIDDIPPGLLWSMPQALDGLARIRQLQRAGYFVIPAHEPVRLPGAEVASEGGRAAEHAVDDQRDD